MKQRRKPRKSYDWIKEISNGNTDLFYKSRDWDMLKEKVFKRDHYTCQFFLGKFDDGIHKPHTIKIVRATMVHHIIPVKERPDLALDINNCVSLSFEGHEIIEDRNQFYFKKYKKVLTSEKW
jgi:5-methylcytosine-specific restriction endonuclease McrA